MPESAVLVAPPERLTRNRTRSESDRRRRWIVIIVCVAAAVASLVALVMTGLPGTVGSKAWTYSLDRLSRHAVAIIRTAGRRPPSLFVWGAKVGPLLDALTDRLPTLGIVGISVPRDHLHALTRRFTVLGGGDWDWMWTTRDTVPDPGLTLVDLDDTRDAAEIAALAAENPRFEGYPGTGTSESWIGWRDDGGHLIACGATQRLPSGVAHLGGILVASRWRGRGLGTAVSAALTARAVATDGVCTLGMYADNDAARSVYERLGYVVDKAWASRTVDLR